MKNKLKIQDLDNFQEDLSQEFAAIDLSSIQGGMLAETTNSVSLTDEQLIAYPLPKPEPKPYPLPPWPPFPCCCYPYPYPLPFPDKPIELASVEKESANRLIASHDSVDSINSVYIGWCPVIL